MRIIVKSKEENTNININVPMGVVITLLRVSKPFIKKYCDEEVAYGKGKYGFKASDVDKIIEGLRYLKKEHKGLSLVDIEESNGDIVKIKI